MRLLLRNCIPARTNHQLQTQTFRDTLEQASPPQPNNPHSNPQHLKPSYIVTIMMAIRQAALVLSTHFAAKPLCCCLSATTVTCHRARARARNSVSTLCKALHQVRHVLPKKKQREREEGMYSYLV